MFINDTVLYAEYIYHRTKYAVRVEKYNEGIHYCTEIRYLQDNGKIKSVKKLLWGGKDFEEECYSPNGMITKKVIIKNGNIITNLTTNDTR